MTLDFLPGPALFFVGIMGNYCHAIEENLTSPSVSPLKTDGGAYGARTRNLYRDRVAL
jgi:hypothetical protein